MYTIFFTGIPESSNDGRLKSFALLPALIKSPLHNCTDSWIPRQGVPPGTKASTTHSLSITVKGTKNKTLTLSSFKFAYDLPRKMG